MQKKEKKNFYNEVDFGKKGNKIEGKLHVCAFLQVIENMNSDNRDIKTLDLKYCLQRQKVDEVASERWQDVGLIEAADNLRRLIKQL